MNINKMIDRVAKSVLDHGDTMVEPFSQYVLITVSGLPTKQADLRTYTRELAMADTHVSYEVLRVMEWAKRHNIRGTRRNTGITPSEGTVGCVVEWNRSVTPEEYKDL